MSVLQSLVSTLSSTAASRTAPPPGPGAVATAAAAAVAVLVAAGAGAEAEAGAPGLRKGLPAMDISGLILASLSDHADATLLVFIQDDHQAMHVRVQQSCRVVELEVTVSGISWYSTEYSSFGLKIWGPSRSMP